MKFSYSWLKDFISLDLPMEALSKHLLLLGFEVTELRETGPDITQVVAAEILRNSRRVVMAVS